MTQSPSERDAAATALVSALGTMAVVVDGDTIVSVTEPLATSAGYEPEQLVGEPRSRLLAEPDPDTGRGKLINADGSQTSVSIRRQQLPTEGDDREWTGLFINEVDGESRDETATGTGEETVDLANTRFKQLFEAVNDAIMLVDTDNNRITWANSRACDLLGYSRQQLLSLEPKAIHPHEYDAFRSFVDEVDETGTGWTSSLSCYTCDGDVIPAEISGTRVTVDGSQHLLASIRDISTRVDQRERLGRQAAAIKAATDGIAIYTAEGRVVYANHAYAELFGFESPESITGRTWGELHAEQQQFSLGISSALSSTGEWRGEVTADGPTDRLAGSQRPLEASLTQLETDEILCVAHDISVQQAHQRRLTGLAAASRELLTAEDCGAVGEVAVDTVIDVLDTHLACVRRYDEETNELTISAISEAAKELQAAELAYDLNSSRAGTAYRRGESVRNEPGDDAYASEASRADLHIPIGEYGVLSVFEPSGSFSDQLVQLLELFAESVRAAFMRADREEQLRSRQADLEARTDELTVATQFNSLVTDLIGLMLRTPHRGEIEQAVCDQLADSRLYEAAWIATVDDETDTVSVPTWTVDTEPFTETRPEAFVSSPFATQLVEEAAATGAPAVTRRQFDSAGSETPDETLAAAVPITVGSQRFGVLAVAGTDDRGFSEPIRSGLRLLGETLGFAFVMEATRSTLIANDAIELEFALTERFAELSSALDCQCLYTGSKANDNGSRTYCIRIQGASCEQAVAHLDAAPGVSDTKRLDDWDDGCLLGITVVDPVPELLADFGVNLRSLVATDGEARLVVEAPEDIDIAALRSTLADRYGSVRLVSKQHGRQERSIGSIGDELEERLTDKQLTVLETAAELGYYDWPREATAEEVAEAVGIASATLHQHLRAAEGKLVATFFDSRR
jgi:PAS domain S-box-containing protein